MHHTLSTHGLYILVGAPGSGKSTWTQNVQGLTPECVISSDALRKQLFGEREIIDKDGSRHVLLSKDGDKAVFDIAYSMVRQRLQQRLPVVVDATNVTISARNAWSSIADDCGVPTTLVMFDVPEHVLIERDLKRSARVGIEVIQSFLKRLEKKSSHPVITVQDDDTFSIAPPQLPHSHIDVIGDVHGLYDDTVAMVSELGYTLNARGVFEHPSNRQLLFLGDWLDRGPDSIKCTELVFKQVTLGGHFAVMGNHEQKVLRAYRKQKLNNEMADVPFAAAETLTKMWAEVPSRTLEKWMDWMHRLPPMYQFGRFFFCHADVQSLDPMRTPCGTLFYGESKFGLVNTDEAFDRWSLAQGDHGPVLFRGHIPPTTEQPQRVFSLERKVGFAGTMMALRLDDCMSCLAAGDSLPSAVEKTTISRKTTFDFKAHMRVARQSLDGMNALVTQKFCASVKDAHFGFLLYSSLSFQDMTQNLSLETLADLKANKMITSRSDDDGSLDIYKYSRKVFYDNLWTAHPYLKHARGLVLDPAGKIVQNPFVKVFNYGENATGQNLPDSTPVIAVEKMNGFLGCITKHPFVPDTLLVTTTGSFNSDFVGYINDFITPALRASMLSHLSSNNETLMFEVIHPDDPHIVEYSADECGLYLIGARCKTLDAPLRSEESLDDTAKILGVRRPSYAYSTLGEVKKDIAHVQHEGFLVRDAVSGEALLKFKSVNYLTIKFLGRMGKAQIEAMFAHPKSFKKKIDEEYFPLVDLLTERSTQEVFSSMSPVERVAMVRGLVQTMRGLHDGTSTRVTPKP